MACMDISKLKHSRIVIHFVDQQSWPPPLSSAPPPPAPSELPPGLQCPLCALGERDLTLFQEEDEENGFLPMTQFFDLLSAGQRAFAF